MVLAIIQISLGQLLFSFLYDYFIFPLVPSFLLALLPSILGGKNKKTKKPRNNQNINSLITSSFLTICMRTFFPFIKDELSELLAKASPIYLYTRSHLLLSTQGHCFSYSFFSASLISLLGSSYRHADTLVRLLFFCSTFSNVFPSSHSE